MPAVLLMISIVGTAAILWVVVTHGLHELGLSWLYNAIKAIVGLGRRNVGCTCVARYRPGRCYCRVGTRHPPVCRLL